MRYIKTLLALILFGFSLSASSQCTDPDACNFNINTVNDVCLSLETVQVHTSGALVGQTTYRLYVNFPSDQDYYISAIAGNDGSLGGLQPTIISTTTTFYQDPVGSETGTTINELLFSSFPDLEYDSWVTIIGENSDFTKEVQTIQDSNSPWLTSFSSGGDITINTQTGGTWFILGQNPDQANNDIEPIGPSTSALIAQLTTDGTIDAQVSVQYFDNDGVTNDNLIANLSLSNACAFGACVYPQTGFDCNGQCVSGDSDGDGICDEFEIAGCQDGGACNYNANATDSDPTSCDYSCLDNTGLSEPCADETSLTYQGVEYDLVEIDGRCWFAEDLRSSSYNNNFPINEINDAAAWKSSSNNEGRSTYFTNNSIGGQYRSYDWYAVETGLLCPSGWHVANNQDWNSLEKTAFNAKSHRLSKQTQLIQGNVQNLYDLDWFGQYTEPDVFTSPVFSGGLRENVDGNWRDADNSIYWWTAEEYTPKAYESKRANSGWARGIKNEASWGRFRDLWSTSNSKNNALRVRCVKGGVETGGLVEGSFYSVYISPGTTSIENYDVGQTYNVGDTLYQDTTMQNPYSYGFKVSNDYGDRLVTDRNGVLILDPDTLFGEYGGGGGPAHDPVCAYCVQTYPDGSCFIVEKCVQNPRKKLGPSEICAQFDLPAATATSQNDCSWGVWVGVDQEKIAKYELTSKLARIGYRLGGEGKSLDGTRVDILPFDVESNRRKENTVSNEEILKANHFIQIDGLYFRFIKNNGEDFLRLEISPIDDGATLPQQWDDINIFTEIGQAKPGELCSCYRQIGNPPACECWRMAQATTKRYGDCPSVCQSYGACTFNCCDPSCGVIDY